ncbi:hypothetical protein CWI37_0809p0010 [Hamiltosporidium tvaerminnensis]|uniref:Uncharacterized protein n=1 Tax=Hamiltosporidium tvaerminnensis TaxID=1176355 RepID=A0A4V2JUQ6_9MICR|nr:hypothetical protein CWI37_0809p0010 [Hamiltosporidium tvaerminnensis]
MFFSIQNTDDRIDYIESEEEEVFEFKIQSKYILDTFTSVYLLKNTYLKCIMRNGSRKYFIPQISKIFDSEDIILSLSIIEDEQNDSPTNKYFLGQISNDFLLRFTKYVTKEDFFVNTLSFIDLINFLRVLEILGFQRTKNNTDFLKHLLVKSLIDENFNFKSYKKLLDSTEQNMNIYNLNFEYFFSVFLHFVFIKKTKNYTFLFFKSNNSMHDHKIILSYKAYIWYRERFYNENVFILESETILQLDKILSLKWAIDCILFFIRSCKIDMFWFAVTENLPSEKIFNLISSIKPKNIKKLIIKDDLMGKNTFKCVLANAYFDTASHVKISCNLNIEEIRNVLVNSKNIKKLEIGSDDAHSDILAELNKYALSHKNIYLKYKCYTFVMDCNRYSFLKNMPENFIFYVQKFHDSFLHCDFCHLQSSKLFRKIITRLNRDTSLKEYKKMFSNCLNVKEAYISTVNNELMEFRHLELIKYIFQIPNLESISFENVICIKILIRYILESKKLISLKFYNSSFLSESFDKCNIKNFTLRGITIKKSRFCLNGDFIKFLSSFEKLIFLKIYIKDIDSGFKKLIVESASNHPKEKFNSKLDYLKITLNENIAKDLPILSVFSYFFEISNLKVLILQINKIEEQDASVISNMKYLKEMHLTVYQNKNKIFLQRLTKILENKTIKLIKIEVKYLDINIFEYICVLENVENIFIYFEQIETEELYSIYKMKLNYSSSITLNCKNDQPLSPDAINFCNEYNIEFSEID